MAWEGDMEVDQQVDLGVGQGSSVSVSGDG